MTGNGQLCTTGGQIGLARNGTTAGERLWQWLGILATWQARARSRQLLAELDGHLLKDIGISRGDALREAAKPFWRP